MFEFQCMLMTLTNTRSLNLFSSRSHNVKVGFYSHFVTPFFITFMVMLALTEASTWIIIVYLWETECCSLLWWMETGQNDRSCTCNWNVKEQKPSSSEITRRKCICIRLPSASYLGYRWSVLTSEDCWFFCWIHVFFSQKQNSCSFFHVNDDRVVITIFLSGIIFF